MSLAQSMPERRPSPGLTFDLGSNNPFRRAASPIPPSPDKALNQNNNLANMSRNPFLDPQYGNGMTKAPQDSASNKMADDIFRDLSGLERTVSNGPPIRSGGPSRSGTMPVSHRPSRSRDMDKDTGRNGLQPSRSRQAPPTASPFDTPPAYNASERPRRNSESSVADKTRSTDEDKRRRERRKEREARREKEGRPKDGKSRSKKPQGLDVIDKLDVTGIYGQGLFHHDGPFDACNPHRNRKRDERAPMQAFPANSANNALGGAAPKSFDHDRFHGRGEEGFTDFAASRAEYVHRANNTAPKRQQDSFDPTSKVEQIHGEESYGLGTSTFLEGAPASKTAVQRRESDNEVPQLENNNAGGLGRKKSLAMRIRGISQPRRPNDYFQGGVVSPEPQYNPRSPSPPGVVSAGGPSRAGPMQSERNPFFNANNDYNDAYDRKGAQIQFAETNGSGRARAQSTSKPIPLTRSVTADSGAAVRGEDQGSKSGGGLLNRMRSLKGGKRPRPDMRPS